LAIFKLLFDSLPFIAHSGLVGQLNFLQRNSSPTKQRTRTLKGTVIDMLKKFGTTEAAFKGTQAAEDYATAIVARFEGLKSLEAPAVHVSRSKKAEFALA
jgi:hypothetical protein